MDKVLLLEEVEKANEVAMLVGTVPVGKTHIAGNIMRQRQRASASRTHEVWPGRKLEVLALVEPEGLARGAHLPGDRDAQTAVERQLGHRSGTIGALHSPMVSSVGGFAPRIRRLAIEAPAPPE